jgi:KAT8 regulatory NSL complex subunit 1
MSKGPIILEAKSDSSTVTSNNGQKSEREGGGDDETDEPSQCVRTMPIKNFRKRRLVRANIALSTAVRRNAKYSTVHCSCRSMPRMSNPCVLCNGRKNYVTVIDTDCMTEAERMAILDPCLHPVLSLPSEVPIGIHFAKILKKETTNKSIAIRKQLDRSNRSLNSKSSQHHKTPSSTSQKTNHIRMRIKSLTNSNQRNRKTSLSSGSKFGVKKTVKFGSRHRHDSQISNGSVDSDWTPSPSPSLPVKRRRRSDLQDAYDINNIVVDYSIASTTRVEKLQYKEILTPKWREIDFTKESPEVISTKEDITPEKKITKLEKQVSYTDTNGNINGNSNGSSERVDIDNEIMEDLSDDAYASRHAKFEEEERKRRFLTFLSRPRRESTREGEEASEKDKTCQSETLKSIRSPITSSLSSPLTSSTGTASSSQH